jgi:hypothetical protein
MSNKCGAEVKTSQVFTSPLLNHHVFIGLGVAFAVGDVPTERLEEGVDEFKAQVGLFVRGSNGRTGVAPRSAGRVRGWLLVLACSLPERGGYRLIIAEGEALDGAVHLVFKVQRTDPGQIGANSLCNHP